MLGEMHLHLIPFSIRIDSISVGEAPNFSIAVPICDGGRSLCGRGADVRCSTVSRQVRDITLNQPKIELIRNRDDVWNFSSLGSGATSGKGEQSSLTLDSLKVTDGQIAVTDQHANSPRTVYTMSISHLLGLPPASLST